MRFSLFREYTELYLNVVILNVLHHLTRATLNKTNKILEFPVVGDSCSHSKILFCFLTF